MPFSFSGWNAFSVAPKTTPGLPPGVQEFQATGGAAGAAPATVTTTPAGTVTPGLGGVGAGTGIPSTVTDAIGGLGVGGNATILSLLERLFSGGGGFGAAPVAAAPSNAGQNWAAIRNQVHRENEAARIGLLREERRRQIIPSLPGQDYLSSRSRQIDQEIEDRLRYNLPAASGWVGGPRY